jgi:hypothetical protein
MAQQKNPAARGEAKRRGRNREEADSLMIPSFTEMSIVCFEDLQRICKHSKENWNISSASWQILPVFSPKTGSFNKTHHPKVLFFGEGLIPAA